MAIPIPIPAFALLLRPAGLTVAGVEDGLGELVAVGGGVGSMTMTEGEELPALVKEEVEDVEEEEREDVEARENVLACTLSSETNVTPTGESTPPPFCAVAN